MADAETFERDEFHFAGYDGEPIYYRTTVPDKFEALVFLCHGLYGHSGRFMHLIQKLAPTGFAFFAMDFRGHGLTKGKRGHIGSFRGLVEDLRILIDRKTMRYPDKPVFLFGHDMGALVVLQYLQDMGNAAPQGGAVLTGTPVPYAHAARPAFCGKLAQWLAPNLQRPGACDPSLEVYDILEDHRYYHDELRHNWITPRTWGELDKAAASVDRWMQLIKRPLFFMHGAHDRLAEVIGPRNLLKKIERAGNTTAELLEIDEGAHDPIHDWGMEEACEAVEAWWCAQLYELKGLQLGPLKPKKKKKKKKVAA